jgi:D-alanyl-D-alanine carboxypeptidase
MAVAGLCFAVAIPAQAAAPLPSPTPAAPTGGTGAGGIEQQPTAEEAAAEARARALKQASAAVTTAERTLQQSSAAASAALETYRARAQAQQQTRLDNLKADAALAQASTDLQSQQVTLGRWARHAYTEGNRLSASPALSALLGAGDEVDAANQMGWLNILGVHQTQIVDTYATAVQTQQRATAAAAGAALAADTAVTDALVAKQQRDAAVAQQQLVVERLRGELAAATTAAATTTGGSSAGATGNAVTGAVGDCVGGDTTAYANGEIPLTVLCPVWQSPGDYLRADAAFSFNKLSAAYSQAFGRPICITDSYRSYPEQVAVYASHPELAARPGSSNHGWGTATDLCGGIESFTTGEHAWLLLNAPTFGWFHPAWAEPGGSKPEAWHWEFGG